MSFFYDFHSVNDNINENPKSGLKVHAVSLGTFGVEYIAERIAERQTFSKGEILGIIHALTEVVETTLANGFNVSLGDLGTFSISASSRTVENKTEIKGASVHFKRVVHRPSKKMTHRLRNVEFKRIPPLLSGKKKKIRANNMHM